MSCSSLHRSSFPFCCNVLDHEQRDWDEKVLFVQFKLIFFAEIIRNTINIQSSLNVVKNFAARFIEDCLGCICLVINNKYTKSNPILGFLGF